MSPAILVIAASVLHGCSSNKTSPVTTTTVQQSTLREDYPLDAGTYWIYKGTVQWQDGKDTRVTPITWKMAVARSERVGRYEVSFVQGHPEDLEWYVPGKARANHVFVSVEGKYYEITMAENLSALLSETEIANKLSTIHPFMVLPLKPGGCLENRADCWEVREPQPADLQNINTPVVRDNAAEYELSLHSSSGQASMRFVPGIGITSYVYKSSRAPGAADLHLVEFHPAGN